MTAPADPRPDPLPPKPRGSATLRVKDVAARLSQLPRGTAAPEVEKLTAFIDVGERVLWWMVCGWSEDFSAWIIDYGAWPGQRSRIFTSRTASPALTSQRTISPSATPSPMSGSFTSNVMRPPRSAQQVEAAMKTLFPNGVDGQDQGLVIRAAFLHLRQQSGTG